MQSEEVLRCGTPSDLYMLVPIGHRAALRIVKGRACGGLFAQKGVHLQTENNGVEQTSIDFTRLIAWIAYFKHGVILNKTQMQKLLFMCYGQALVLSGKPLFRDDTPKAWPFGPVFPRSYKRYEEHVPEDLAIEEKRQFASSPEVLRMVAQTVADYCRVSATRLSDWSHRSGSPWQKTVFLDGKAAWNREIGDEMIKEYFSTPNWRAGI